jgi:Hypothetical protein (DUF2513)
METTSMGGQSQSAVISGITPQGHDFIDAGRNDTVWRQAIAKAKEKAAA